MDLNELIQLRKDNNFKQIIEWADKTKPSQMKNESLILSIAEVYAKLENYENSILWYERAIDLGTSEDAITPLAELYRITGKGVNRWSWLYETLEHSEVDKRQLRMISYEKSLQENGKSNETIDILNSYLEEELYDFYLVELAEAYIQSGELKQAKKSLNKALRISNHEMILEYARDLLEQVEDGNIKSPTTSIRRMIYPTEKQAAGADSIIKGNHEKRKDNDSLEIDDIDQEIVEEQKQNQDEIALQNTVTKTDRGNKAPLTDRANTITQNENPHKERSLADIFRHGKKKHKKKKEIIRSIEMLFSDVVGMDTIKEELQSFYNVLQFQNQIQSRGVGGILHKNFVICGERGSGKTLVASKLAEMLSLFGITDSDELVEVNSRDVQDAYSNGGTKGLLELFSELHGVVVVIDHMDRLWEEESTSQTNHSKLAFIESMAELIKEREDSLVFVLSGKKAAMDSFVNEDIKKYIHSTLYIKGYSNEELVDIACLMAENRGFAVSSVARKALSKNIKIARCTGDFANALTLEVILQNAIKRKADRQRESNQSINDHKLVEFDAEDFEVEDESTETIEELLAKLDNLTGLASVKKDVKSKIESIHVQQQAMENGAKRKEDFGTLHMLFKGSPGTGKTTVARIIGKIYQKLGVLPRGHIFVECSRKDLVGEYQGHTAKRTHEKVQEALGGILFIDEAYSLVQGEGDTFGMEALNTLVADIENYRDSILVILAGYSEEIDQLLARNPGLASRFPNEIIFEDYKQEEMADIFRYMVREKGLILDYDTTAAVKQLIGEKASKKNFGNARGVRNLVEKVKSAMDHRLAQMQMEHIELSKNDFDIVKTADIEAVMNQRSEKEKTVEELLEDLNRMTGLASVKSKVQEMVAVIRRNQLSKKLNPDVTMDFGSLHLVFLGNAGTGKTTVARLIGQIYEKLGVLKNGDIFVECSRAGLIGQYQGQTTKRVEEKVKEALGGILFIDEAYDLCHESQDSYGREIVSTLLKAIEDYRDNLMVIMAGYEKEMKRFFDTNQGLKSRMATEVYFDDYNGKEMTEIFYYMANKNSYIVEQGLEDIVFEIIEQERGKNKDFGNARGVRNIYEKVLRKQAVRLLQIQSEQITKEVLYTITEEDLRI